LSIAIAMPALPSAMAERYLARGHVKLDDKVKPAHVIAEFETDKTTMEIEAVFERIVCVLFFEKGRWA